MFLQLDLGAALVPKNVKIIRVSSGINRLLSTIATASSMQAALFTLNLSGNAGSGLLPGNEVGANTASAATSSSFGGEVGNGFVLDTTANTLDFAFDFTLNGSTLADVASGIHLHLVSNPSDPFNSTGGIAFNLNSGSDANVVLNDGPIGIGASGGLLSGVVNNLTSTQEQDFPSGNYYVNIHTSEFGGGELRGNVVPEPSAYALLAGIFAIGLAVTRRRFR